MLRLEPRHFELFRDKSLILIGDCDPTCFHPTVLRTLREGQLKFEIIKDAGHTMNIDFTPTINGKTVDFLSR